MMNMSLSDQIKNLIKINVGTYKSKINNILFKK